MANRDELIDKIIQDPQSLTADEMSLVAADPELAETYNITVALRRSATPAPTMDVESGLRDLHQHMGVGERRRSPWHRRTAAILAIALSLVAIACVWMREGEKSVPAVVPIAPDTVMAEWSRQQDDAAEASQGLIYDATIEEILTDVAQRYQSQVVYSDSADRTVRLHVTIPRKATIADVVETLDAFDNVTVSLSGNNIYVR